MNRLSFSRRSVLRTLAAIPFTAPLARAFAAPGATPPKRLVLFMQNNGTQQGSFWPQPPAAPLAGVASPATPLLRSPILNALFGRQVNGEAGSGDGNDNGTDNGLAAKTNLIKGVTIPLDAHGTNGNEHDIGFARMFTGEKLISRGGQPWGGGTSVDQMLANHWGVDSLTLAAHTSKYESQPKPGFNHRRSFCYVGPATLKYPLLDPMRVYRKLFATGDGVDVRQRLLLRKSVLDAVTGNLSEVAGRLGPDDGRKLDYHLTAIRDVERRLSNTLSSNRIACSVTPKPPRDFAAIDPSFELNSELFLPELIDSLIDLAAVALTCGLTRIATMQFGFGGGKWSFWWKGIDTEIHENIAHRDSSDAGSSPENTAKLVLINQYYASRVARLATALNAAPEGGGSILDNTLVVWANEFGRGNHDLRNVPIVMLGMVGNGIPAGGRVIDRGEQPFNRLGCSILNIAGKPTLGFGDQPTCGSFTGLLS